MRVGLKKLVDILIIKRNCIKLGIYTLEVMGGARHFGRLVSLSPAVHKPHPYLQHQKPFLHKKRAVDTQYVEETIEDSHYVLGFTALVISLYFHAQISSDTILNSTSIYPKISTIANKKQTMIKRRCNGLH
jgi:hypothetical protein